MNELACGCFVLGGNTLWESKFVPLCPKALELSSIYRLAIKTSWIGDYGQKLEAVDAARTMYLAHFEVEA